MKYAELNINNTVTHIHDSDPNFNSGIQVIQIPDESSVDIGWEYIYGNFEMQRPNQYYIWDSISSDWVVDTEAAATAIRDRREHLFSLTVDKINAIRGAAMGSAAWHEWEVYRQALLNITEQAGFPWGGPDDPSCPWPMEPTIDDDAADVISDNSDVISSEEVSSTLSSISDIVDGMADGDTKTALLGILAVLQSQ